jgi:hypothetical protein
MIEQSTLFPGTRLMVSRFPGIADIPARDIEVDLHYCLTMLAAAVEDARQVEPGWFGSYYARYYGIIRER